MLLANRIHSLYENSVDRWFRRVLQNTPFNTNFLWVIQANYYSNIKVVEGSVVASMWKSDCYYLLETLQNLAAAAHSFKCRFFPALLRTFVEGWARESVTKKDTYRVLSYISLLHMFTVAWPSRWSDCNFSLGHTSDYSWPVMAVERPARLPYAEKSLHRNMKSAPSSFIVLEGLIILTVLSVMPSSQAANRFQKMARPNDDSVSSRIGALRFQLSLFLPRKNSSFKAVERPLESYWS